LISCKEEVGTQVIYVKSVMFKYLMVAQIHIDSILESTKALTPPEINPRIEIHHYMKVFVIFHMFNLLLYSPCAFLVIKLLKLLSHFIWSCWEIQ